jgi:hypothetical protein
MDFAIDFNKAAFGHKVSKEDILMAFDNVQYDAILEEDDPDAENKHLLIGFDRTVTTDDFSANYLMIKAMDTHKTPVEIIGEMVRKEIAAAV